MEIKKVWVMICIIFMVLVGEKEASTPPDDVVLCPLSHYIDENGKDVKEYFQCPGPEDPSHYSLCCQEKCCANPITFHSILQVDIRIAMMISLSVIILCIISGVTIIICCFVKSCPLYDSCLGSTWDIPGGGGYMPGDMHPLTLNGMPSETEENLQKKYKMAFDSNIKISLDDADHV